MARAKRSIADSGPPNQMITQAAKLRLSQIGIERKRAID
jgi:hypothetical protein